MTRIIFLCEGQKHVLIIIIFYVESCKNFKLENYKKWGRILFLLIFKRAPFYFNLHFFFLLFFVALKSDETKMKKRDELNKRNKWKFNEFVMSQSFLCFLLLNFHYELFCCFYFIYFIAIEIMNFKI